MYGYGPPWPHVVPHGQPTWDPRLSRLQKQGGTNVGCPCGDPYWCPYGAHIDPIYNAIVLKIHGCRNWGGGGDNFGNLKKRCHFKNSNV